MRRQFAELVSFVRARGVDPVLFFASVLGRDLTEDELAQLPALLAADEKQGKRRPRVAAAPQQTWPEFEQVVSSVIVDGPQGLNWRRIVGEIALAHEGPTFTLRLGELNPPSAAPLLAGSYEELEEHLANMHGVRSVLAFNYVLARAVEKPGGYTLPIDELVLASGPRPRSEAERKQRRREVWHDLRTFAHVGVFGRRRAYAPKKGESDILATFGPLIAFLEVADTPGQLALDGSEPPREVTLQAGPWLARIVQDDPSLLPFFVDTRAIAQLPDEQPHYAWAKAIGWALNHRLRVSAQNATERRQGEDANGKPKPPKLETRPFTRRELLDYLNPGPRYADILAGPHPKRAVRLWDDAIALLKQQGVIGTGRGDYVEHGPAPWRKPKDWPKGKLFKPQGWQAAWLEQKLTIRPGPNGQELLRDLRRRSAKGLKRPAKST
jgi:hypothetical protein